MTPLLLAWSNLSQQRARTAISVVGVAFAVLLVFMQLGFLDAVRRTATLLYDKLDFDLIVISREYGNLTRPAAFPRRRLAPVAAVQGVERVLPLTSSLGLWTQPSRPGDDPEQPRARWSILVLAADPASLDQLFRPDSEVFRDRKAMEAAAVQLARLDTVLMDLTSRKREYGDAETWSREPFNELSGRRVEVVGELKIGIGFAYSGLLLTSEATLTRLTRWPEDQVSFGLVKLADGVDVEQAREEIERQLPPEESDVEVHTRRWLNEKEEKFWMTGTAIGQFFTVGVVIAVLVGGVFVYQMMAADIARRLPEYATVRALGYPPDFLVRVVYWQGFLLAALGYLPGLAASLLGYLVTHKLADVPIEMTLWRAVYVLGLTVVMCMTSAVLAVRAVRTANPADLF